MASGLYKGQGTWSGYSSSAEKCRDQHNPSRTVQQRRKVLGPPTGTTLYVQGQGRAFGGGGVTYHRNHKYDQTIPKGRDSCRLTTDAGPFALFLEKKKGCTILSFVTANKSIRIFLKRCESLQFLQSSLFSIFFPFYIFSLGTGITLGRLPFLHR